ncbi:MAG: hypothetical protein R3337_09195 [Gammaproteobacteria bacterium]|nr:hypothetical protein [Gammaproteobacteria bacterium]
MVTAHPGAENRLPQGLPFIAGISRRSAGSSGICVYKVVIPPGAAAEPHSQVNFETGIHVLKEG